LCDAPCVVVYNNIYLLRMRCCLISPPPQRCAALYYYNVCYTVRNHCTTHCTARVSKRRRSTFRAMCLLSFSLIPPLPSMPIPSGLPLRDGPPWPLPTIYIRVINAPTARVEYCIILYFTRASLFLRTASTAYLLQSTRYSTEPSIPQFRRRVVYWTYTSGFSYWTVHLVRVVIAL
jgi:hypothetical protein